MKIFTIIGARPQFIKASVVSKAFQKIEGISEVLLHTGQHFDDNMSDIFFEQLLIPRPNYMLNINNSRTHGEMTGLMLIEIEKALLEENPDCVLVYGDTNSTLAGALASAKLNIPLVHVEAGLRSFNMHMPEEINRILTDQVSQILFCPTQTALNNLLAEGFENKSVKLLNVGDVMLDSAKLFADRATSPKQFHINEGFILTTLHRAENTDVPARLESIVMALNIVHREVAPVVLPLHPRTKKAIEKAKLKLNVHLIEPAGYLEMIWLLKHSGLVVTDSGGVQKEAYFFGRKCITMRDQTEWLELIETGANVLVGADKDKIVATVKENHGKFIEDELLLYGGGLAAKRIAEYLKETFNL